MPACTLCPACCIHLQMTICRKLNVSAVCHLRPLFHWLLTKESWDPFKRNLNQAFEGCPYLLAMFQDDQAPPSPTVCHLGQDTRHPTHGPATCQLPVLCPRQSPQQQSARSRVSCPAAPFPSQSQRGVDGRRQRTLQQSAAWRRERCPHPAGPWGKWASPCSCSGHSQQQTWFDLSISATQVRSHFVWASTVFKQGKPFSRPGRGLG